MDHHSFRTFFTDSRSFFMLGFFFWRARFSLRYSSWSWRRKMSVKGLTQHTHRLYCKGLNRCLKWPSGSCSFHIVHSKASFFMVCSHSHIQQRRSMVFALFFPFLYIIILCLLLFSWAIIMVKKNSTYTVDLDSKPENTTIKSDFSLTLKTEEWLKERKRGVHQCQVREHVSHLLWSHAKVRGTKCQKEKTGKP